MKKWMILHQRTENNKQITENEIIDILLKNRNIKTEKEKEDFLNPILSDFTYNDLKLSKKELDKAVARIKKAITQNEQIIVYTDYDADGVCSGTIIWEKLYEMGAKIMPYVPHRIEEGYGLSQKGIDRVFKESNARLIITVDHGVTAAEKVEYANKLGIDVIIIDHHTLPDKLPKPVALVHTTFLCATGLAWFFANYLNPYKNKYHNLDLVAVATIADLIPLTGFNRILVKFGLEELNKTKRIGLLALIKSSGLETGDIGVYEVGHILAPRINASGRLTHALDSLRLLCTKDRERAKQLAQILSDTNKERQTLLAETVAHAMEINKLKNKTKKLIFLAEENYNQGVIGLVAGKLTEEFYRPSVVISKGEKYSKASARSIPGFNIVDAIRKFSELLIDVGGHPMAAGFTIETNKLSMLEEKLVQFAGEILNDDNLEKQLKIDCQIEPDCIDEKLYGSIKRFEPFGMGNPQPVFVSYDVKIARVRLVGKDRSHIKITIQPNPKYNNYIEAIGFGMAKFFDEYTIDKNIDIVYTIDENMWNNKRSLQLKLKDVKISEVKLKRQ